MKKGITYWLRWIFILPGALIGGLLSTFLLHWILFLTLSNFIEPYPEFPERILTPFAISLAFIWVGSEIAPDHKFKTGLILFVTWLSLLFYIIFFALSGETMYGYELYLKEGGLTSLLGIVGTFVGLYIVKKKYK